MEFEDLLDRDRLEIYRETPAFEWPRPEDCQIITEPAHQRMVDFSDPSRKRSAFDAVLDKLTKDHRVLVVSDASEMYDPLDDPRLCFNFAGVRDETSLLSFVQSYGLPRRRRMISLPCTGTLVDEVLIDAQNMKPGVECLKAISDAEKSVDFRRLRAWGRASKADGVSPRRSTDLDRALLVTCKIELVSHLRRHLDGVSLTTTIDIDGLEEWFRSRGVRSIPNIQPRYTFTDLLGAMWFQIYFIATKGRVIRDKCKHCGEAFLVKDARQQYCTLACRKRKNSQDSYASRHKGGC